MSPQELMLINNLGWKLLAGDQPSPRNKGITCILCKWIHKLLKKLNFKYSILPTLQDLWRCKWSTSHSTTIDYMQEQETSIYRSDFNLQFFLTRALYVICFISNTCNSPTCLYHTLVRGHHAAHTPTIQRIFSADAVVFWSFVCSVVFYFQGLLVVFMLSLLF